VRIIFYDFITRSITTRFRVYRAAAAVFLHLARENFGPTAGCVSMTHSACCGCCNGWATDQDRHRINTTPRTWLANELRQLDLTLSGGVVTTAPAIRRCRSSQAMSSPSISCDWKGIGGLRLELSALAEARNTRSADNFLPTPKIAEPTRIWVAPNWIAVAKSALMPIDRFFNPLRRRFSRSARNAVPAPGRPGEYTSVGNGQAVIVAAARDESVRSAGAMPAFCGSSRIELNE